MAVILQLNQPDVGKQEDFLSSLAFSLSTALRRISRIPGLDISQGTQQPAPEHSKKQAP